jgi:hypothetical protein
LGAFGAPKRSLDLFGNSNRQNLVLTSTKKHGLLING